MAEQPGLVRRTRDDELQDDLAGVDLASLDLDHIRLESDSPRDSTLGRLLALIVLLGLGALLLWIPSTEWFQLEGHKGGILFILSGAGIAVGLSLGRLLLRWAEAARPTSDPDDTQATARPRRPSALLRWLTIIAVIGGTAAIIFGVPASAYYTQGQTGYSSWFLAALGAVVVGILLGRWLLMQAHAAPDDSRPRAPVKLPPYFKWVTLGVLGVGALAILIGQVFFGSDGTNGSFEFGLGAVAFVIGVGGAIWLARRFDEFERSRTAAKKPNHFRSATRGG